MNLPPFGTAFRCQTNGGAVDGQRPRTDFLPAFLSERVRPVLTPFVIAADPHQGAAPADVCVAA